MRVFVLLFNAGTDQEGIHTLNVGAHNIVLMFEDEDDATRYALLLEAQDFMVPSVEPIDREEIEEFCRGAHYDCQLVPKGFVPQTEFDRLMIAPPQLNLEQTDWETDQEKPEVADEDEETGEFSSTELDQIRRRLEGLL